MDDNKLDKLREIGYSISKCCWMCKHSKLRDYWGTCEKFTYEHKKHEGGGKGSVRALSIYAHGCCKEFNPRNSALADIDHYKEFYDK